MESIWKLELEIPGVQAAQINETQRVCMVEWAFGEEDFEIGPIAGDGSQTIWVAGTGTLYANESEEELEARLIAAIHRVNGGLCCVKITPTCLRRIEPELAVLAEADLAMD